MIDVFMGAGNYQILEQNQKYKKYIVMMYIKGAIFHTVRFMRLGANKIYRRGV